MTSDLPGAIDLYGGIPDRPRVGVVVAGDSYLDDQGRLEVRLAIKDDAGERDVQCHEGDIFEFAGTTWRVTRIFEPYMGGRSRIATISQIE